MVPHRFIESLLMAVTTYAFFFHDCHGVHTAVAIRAEAAYSMLLLCKIL